jgi:hypothetical protein
VSVGLGNLGFGVRSSVTVGSPGQSSKMLEDELGEGTNHSDFPAGTPPDSRDAALEPGSVVPSPLDSRGVVPLHPRGVVPPDPRDHTVLETIYNEMHSDRWINLSPLSLLANTVGSWFKGESLSFIPSILSEEYDDGELQVRWAYISGSSKTSILVKTHSLFFCT